MVRKWVLAVRNWVLFLLGLAVFAISGRTPEWAYFAMRGLYGLTDGRLNDAWRSSARRTRPYHAEPVDGLLGAWTVADLEAVAATVHQEGYAILDRMLADDVCSQLEAYARTTPALPLSGQGAELYSSDGARALRYDFAQTELLKSELIRGVAFEDTFTAMAGTYFGARPLFDYVTMWWTTAHGPRDLSAAAQLFHFDMDRPYFLKFFVYLTDVDPKTGPHVFVKGSHRRKPAALRADRRFSDEEVALHYPADAICPIIGPRGTVFAADTRGLHKGAPVVQGERLALEVDYTISKFGQSY